MVQIISSTNFNQPVGIAVDATKIYVANYATTPPPLPSICTFNLADVTPQTKIVGTRSDNKMDGPYGITVDAGYIYLVDNGNNSIRVFNLGDNGDVAPQRVIGSLGGPAFISKGPSTPPAAPNGLAAAPASPTQIDLVWTDNSSNETGFKIFRDGTLKPDLRFSETVR